jgi:hypothetical protein
LRSVAWHRVGIVGHCPYLSEVRANQPPAVVEVTSARYDECSRAPLHRLPDSGIAVDINGSAKHADDVRIVLLLDCSWLCEVNLDSRNHREVR